MTILVILFYEFFLVCFLTYLASFHRNGHYNSLSLDFGTLFQTKFSSELTFTTKCSDWILIVYACSLHKSISVGDYTIPFWYKNDNFV